MSSGWHSPWRASSDGWSDLAETVEPSPDGDLVRVVGLEPTRPCEPQDFKSCAYASFATPAPGTCSFNDAGGSVSQWANIWKVCVRLARVTTGERTTSELLPTDVALLPIDWLESGSWLGWQRILSPLRLPISPLRQQAEYYHRIKNLHHFIWRFHRRVLMPSCRPVLDRS